MTFSIDNLNGLCTLLMHELNLCIQLETNYIIYSHFIKLCIKYSYLSHPHDEVKTHNH